MLTKWGLVFLLSVSRSEYCSIQKTGNLVTKNGDFTWDIPINSLNLEKQVKAIQTELQFQTSDYESLLFDDGNKTFRVMVPKETTPLTLARGKCLEMRAKCITVKQIVEAKLNERYKEVNSINFVMKGKDKTTCNLRGEEEETECIKHMRTLAESLKLNMNETEVENFLDNHKLGLLAVKGSKLTLSSGTHTILPCVSESKNEAPPSKWTILKENYLKPRTIKVLKLLKLVRKTMKTGEQDRKKRSLFSSIFGLASASETQSLRKALKVELGNQQQTNKAMAELLRNQVRAAENLDKENKILFKLEKEEIELEDKVRSLKTFLEGAFSNNTELTTRLRQDMLAILRTFTLDKRLENLEKQLTTILDILHCPSGACRRILEEIMDRENIGETETYDMILRRVTTTHENGQIQVKLQNITIANQLVTVKCLPFTKENKTVKLQYDTELAVSKKGVFIPKRNCMKESDFVLCPGEPIFFKDSCLENLLGNKTLETCPYVEDNTTIQDFISDSKTIKMYSRVEDKMTMKTQTFQFETQLKPGINTFKLSNKEDHDIETSYISFKIKNNEKHTHKVLSTSEMGNLSPTNENEENLKLDQVKVRLENLEEIEVPNLTIDKDERPALEMESIDLPHPALIYLTTPSQSWYIWMLIGVTLTLVTSAISYCKCKDKACFKKRQRENENVEMETNNKQESESETLLCNQQPKYTEMILKDLGFTKEIITKQNGKTYYWNGACWRDEENKLEPSFREPPSYLKAELIPFKEGCVIGEKDSIPYIHLKHFPETNFNKIRNCFEITMNNKTRLLPAYAAPKPSVEILQKHTRAIMEVQKRKLNESCS